MPKISPNGGKSLTPNNLPILEEFRKGSPKRGRNLPQGEKELPPKREGGRRSGLKRRRHVLLRMEEIKQVGVKCKKSLDVELFDGFKHCNACSEKRRVYRKLFCKLHKKKLA